MRKAALIALIALFALTACASPCALAPPSNETVTYACADGSALSASFEAGLVRIVQSGYRGDVTLPAKPSGAGYRYARHGLELLGAGRGVLWTRPGAGQLSCAAPL